MDRSTLHETLARTGPTLHLRTCPKAAADSTSIPRHIERVRHILQFTVGFSAIISRTSIVPTIMERRAFEPQSARRAVRWTVPPESLEKIPTERDFSTRGPSLECL